MEIDYSAIGLKSGLEIHQQLDTGKLFCHCPGVLRKDAPDFVVERRLHAVAGESGEVDVAASYQASLNKSYVYEGYDTTCLVELDEEPPHLINEDALKVALHIALLLNCKIIQNTQVMRKTVVDGSNTGGFQRTVLIAQDGFITLENGKKVGIESICLEEDSARKVKEEGNKIYFRLDRLGIPLVEIATAPDLTMPEEAKEAALTLGKILRVCNVKRGLGTIRQDVNLSVKNGKRIEIKGFQDIRNIEDTMKNEALRQVDLVKEKKSVAEVRKANNDKTFTTSFLRPMPGAARMYPETDLPLLHISKNFIDEAKKSLPELKSDEVLEKELKKAGLSEEMIKLILKQGVEGVENFKELYSVVKMPNLIAKMLVMFPKEIASKEKKSVEDVREFLHNDILIEILKAVKEKKIAEGDVKDVLLEIVKSNGEISLKDALKVKKVDMSGVEEKILKIIKAKPGLNANAYMGLVMKEFGGKMNGKTAMEIIGKFVK